MLYEKDTKPRIDPIQDLGRDLDPPTDQNYCHKQTVIFHSKNADIVL